MWKDVTEHMRCQADKRPYGCNMCLKAFSVPIELTGLMKTPKGSDFNICCTHVLAKCLKCLRFQIARSSTKSHIYKI